MNAKPSHRDLEQRLRSDAGDWARTQPPPLDHRTLVEPDARVGVSANSADPSPNATIKSGRSVAAAAWSLATAALFMLAVGWFLWPANFRSGESSVPAAKIDPTPVLATLAAGRQVSRQVIDSVDELGDRFVDASARVNRRVRFDRVLRFSSSSSSKSP